MRRGASVWITGAASGIGRALSREFLSRGARVLAIDLSAEALADLSAEAALLGFKLETLEADVSSRVAFLSKLERSLALHGAPEILINNAGIARVAAFSEGLDAFDRILRVNLDGVVTGSHFGLKAMASGGTIVNMASMAGHIPAAYMASYSASKFAVVGFTRALQAELSMARSRVRLCLVSPGFVDTPIMAQPGQPFPWWLRWMVATPARAARSIAAGVTAGRAEIYPDAGGRLMRALYALAPKTTMACSRVLLAKTLPQALGMAPILGPGAGR